MFGINKRIKAVHGEEPGEPRKTGDKLTLVQDQAALAIVVSAAAIILVAIVSIVLARNVETLTKQTSTLLERLADTQGAVKSLTDDLASVKGSMGVMRGDISDFKVRAREGGERSEAADASGSAETAKASAGKSAALAAPLAEAERLLLELRSDAPAQAEKLDRVLDLLRAAARPKADSVPAREDGRVQAGVN